MSIEGVATFESVNFGSESGKGSVVTFHACTLLRKILISSPTQSNLHDIPEVKLVISLSMIKVCLTMVR